MCLLCSLSLQLHLPPTSLRSPLITRTDRQRVKEREGGGAFVSQMHFSELSKSLNCIARPNAQRQRRRQRGSEREQGRGCARLGRGAIRSNTFKRITPELSHTHTYINTLAYTVVHKESKRKRATHKRQKSNLRCSDKSSKPACCSAAAAAAALLLPSLTVYLVR